MPPPDASPIRVFIVEDYKVIRLGLKSLLHHDPAIVIAGEAGTGHSALEQIQQHRPDVVLMDLDLPDISGVEVTQTLKQTLPDIKVIMLTSHHEKDRVLAALAAGAQGYCLKKIDSERLIGVVKTVYDGAAWLDPTIASAALQLFSHHAQQSPHTAPLPESTVPFSDREMAVLKLLVDGNSNTAIAQELGISPHTAKAHVCTILQKLAVTDRVQAAVKVVRQGLF